MILSLELTPEMEARYREGVAQHNKAQVREALVLAVEDYVESMMPFPPAPLSPDEWEQALDDLDAFLASVLPKDAPVLSDYAISREGIYGDHP